MKTVKKITFTEHEFVRLLHAQAKRLQELSARPDSMGNRVELKLNTCLDIAAETYGHKDYTTLLQYIRSK